MKTFLAIAVLLIVCLAYAYPATMTQAQATVKAQSIWGPGGWAKKVGNKYLVGCTLNGDEKTEGAGASYPNAFTKVNPVNGIHLTTVTDHGLTSQGQPFIVCW